MTFRLIVLSPPADPERREARFPPLPAPAAAPLVPGPVLADALRRTGAVWTSAAAGCAALAGHLSREGASPAPDPALDEVDLGRWGGRALADVAEAESAAVSLWLADCTAAPHGGESLAHVVGRTAAWLDGLHAESGTGLVVVPPLVLRALCVTALGAPPGMMWRLDVEPGSWADLRSDGHRWVLRGAGIPAEA